MTLATVSKYRVLNKTNIHEITEMITSIQVFLILQITFVKTLSQASVPESLLESELPNPIVHTPEGSFRGLRAKDGNYSMFLGIPYAHVDPDNVFGQAIPNKFQGIFNAYEDSKRCPQIEEFNNTITGTLDCLQLNIHVPIRASINIPLPVMVFIFGGKFEFGFPGNFLYGPRFLVRNDVIFVGLNHRLGPYGFMCLNNSKVSGNQGLKDQVIALRWIKQNIRFFGGDDTRITVSGSSAGSTAVDLHQYFLREQLFHRVILQSGVAINYAAIQEDPDYEAPIKLSKQLNYTTNDIYDALSYLSKVEPNLLIAAQRDSGLKFGVCVEKHFNDGDGYITKHPINMKKQRDVDVLIGFSNDEGYSFVVRFTDEEKEAFSFSRIWDKSFEFGNETKLSDEIKTIVRQFYYGDEVPRTDMKSNIDFYSDFIFYGSFLRTVRKCLEGGIENIYLYMFSYVGERSFMKDIRNIPWTEGGAAHADELGYLYDVSYMKDRVRDEDMLMVDIMTKLWTDFVKYGNPTPKPSKLIPLQWPRVTQDKLPYLDINSELRVGSRPMKERMSFQELLYKAVGRYQRGYDAGAAEDNLLL